MSLHVGCGSDTPEAAAPPPDPLALATPQDKNPDPNILEIDLEARPATKALGAAAEGAAGCSLRMRDARRTLVLCPAASVRLKGAGLSAASAGLDTGRAGSTVAPVCNCSGVAFGSIGEGFGLAAGSYSGISDERLKRL